MNDCNYCVYVHTNKKNGKMYVGCTRMRLNERWGLKGNGYVSSPKFYEAITSYGWDNFDHEVVFDHMDKETALQMEEILIREFDTVDNGYNGMYSSLTGHKQHTLENKLKISKANKGHTMSEEGKRSISRNRKGVKYSEETLRKRSEKLKGKNTKRIMNTNTGVIYKSIGECCLMEGLPDPGSFRGNVDNAHKGNNTKSKFFKFKYLD